MSSARAAPWVAALLLAVGCGRLPHLHVSAESWPEADQLFRGDPLWLGSDGAYSTDLGGGRILWLFGDTLIARDARRSRQDPAFIHNTLGIQTGSDPSRALISFSWRTQTGAPSSFFPERDGDWFWPSGAARVGTGLIVFAQRVRQHGVGQGGFLVASGAAFFISDADADPSTWQPVDAQAPDFGSRMILGTATLVQDGELYVYGTRDGELHDYVVARFKLSDAAAGDLTQGELFDSGQWVSASSLNGPPRAIFDIGAPESSVHLDPHVGALLMTQTEGYPSSTLAFRSADRPEGPWTDPQSFFRPPESFLDGTFVYAGKAHPELTGADLAVTYFPSTFEGSPPLPFPDDFYPRFVKVTF